jgi:dephospho-CoA kinase
MHPVLHRIIQQKVEIFRGKGNSIVVLEAALLIEANWKTLVDQVWVTVAPETVIVDRLKSQRGYNKEQIEARLRTQMPQKEKVKYADVIIDTDCSRDELKAQVVKLWQKLQVS